MRPRGHLRRPPPITTVSCTRRRTSRTIETTTSHRLKRPRTRSRRKVGRHVLQLGAKDVSQENISHTIQSPNLLVEAQCFIWVPISLGIPQASLKLHYYIAGFLGRRHADTSPALTKKACLVTQSLGLTPLSPRELYHGNFRASGSVRRHCPLPFLLLPLFLVSLVCSVVLSPSLCSHPPHPPKPLSPQSPSLVCMHACT